MSTTNTARRDRANEAYQIYMGKNNPKKSPQPPQFNPYTKLIMPTTLSGYLVSMEYTNPNPYQWHTLICGDKTIIEFGIEYRRDEGLQTKDNNIDEYEKLDELKVYNFKTDDDNCHYAVTEMSFLEIKSIISASGGIIGKAI